MKGDFRKPAFLGGPLSGHPFKPLGGLRVGIHLLFRESPSLRIPRSAFVASKSARVIQIPRICRKSKFIEGFKENARGLMRECVNHVRVWIGRKKRFNRRMSRIAASIPGREGGARASIFIFVKKAVIAGDARRVCVRRDL